jgi:hypothetical protein
MQHISLEGVAIGTVEYVMEETFVCNPNGNGFCLTAENMSVALVDAIPFI